MSFGDLQIEDEVVKVLYGRISDTIFYLVMEPWVGGVIIQYYIPNLVY